MAAEGFLSHLEALRKAVLEILAIFIVLLIPAWYFAPDFLHYLQNIAGKVTESNGGRFDLRYFTLMEPFIVELKSGMLLAFAAGLPLYFWRFWVFMAPALYKRERKFLLAGAIAAWGLFVAGAALGLFGVMPLLVKFSISFAREGLTPLIGLNNFVGLLMMVVLAFGAMFELPIVLLALLKAGIIELATLKKQRPLVLVIILVLAAFLTPPDVISQLMLGIPTYLLFEATLIIGRFLTLPQKDNNTDNNESSSLNSEDFTPAAEEEGGEYAMENEDSYSNNNCYHRRKKRRTAPVVRKKARK